MAGSLVLGWTVVFGAGGTGGDDVGSGFPVSERDVCLGCCWSTVLHIRSLKWATFIRRDGLDNGTM